MATKQKVNKSPRVGDASAALCLHELDSLRVLTDCCSSFDLGAVHKTHVNRVERVQWPCRVFSADRWAGRRLLRQGADAASKIAGQDLPAITAFSEEQSPEVKDKVFEDFNSLAVVYRTPASSFIKVRSVNFIDHSAFFWLDLGLFASAAFIQPSSVAPNSDSASGDCMNTLHCSACRTRAAAVLEPCAVIIVKSCIS